MKSARSARMPLRARFLMGVAGALLLPVMAQAQQVAAAAQTQQVAAAQPPAENIVVTGNIYRDRSAAVAPTLEYGLDYFQPFEPLTVGDMLKRTPSIAFVSDILEFDGVRMRGLDPGYTQILINGKRVPGADVDRSFWVDRIPAELVDRVEIVRSASANRSGDAVAGALNIVLRDTYEFTGTYARAGALYFDDGKLKPVLGAVMSGAVGPGRGLLGINIQGRHNPKVKQSLRYEPEDGVLEFANREDQSDVRDGTDYSANGELTFPVGTGDLKLTGFVVHTDRTESENSREYEDLTSVDPADLTVLTPQFEDISQDNYTLAAGLTQNMFGGETGFSADFTRFSEDIVSTEVETEYDPYPDVDDFGGTRTFSDTVDRAWSLRIDHKHPIGMATLEFGADYNNKKRDGDVAEAEIDSQGDSYPAPEPVTGGFYTIDEERIDPFAVVSGTSGNFSWEAGVRYEHTTSKIVDRVTDISGKSDYGFILPSGHVRVQLNDLDRISLSAARTVRRPNFDSLAPILLEEEPVEENDFLGNPDLNPGKRLGFRYRL